MYRLNEKAVLFLPTETVEPGIRLGKRAATLHAAEGQAERDVIARRLPWQQGIVLEEDADLRAREARLDRSGKRPLQPDRRAQQA